MKDYLAQSVCTVASFVDYCGMIVKPYFMLGLRLPQLPFFMLVQ